MKTEHRMSDLELSQATLVKDEILKLVQTLGQSGRCTPNGAVIGVVNALATIFAALHPNDRMLVRIVNVLAAVVERLSTYNAGRGDRDIAQSVHLDSVKLNMDVNKDNSHRGS
jgi:hypothetical protein